MFMFKDLFGTWARTKSAPSGPETAPFKMNLEERMEFRREMLYDALKVTMQAHGILSSSYRYRVVCEDRRGHQYSVLMDLSTDFMHNRQGRPEQLVSLGASIRKSAAVRYRLVVTGVYWQVNDRIQGFGATADELAAVEAVGQNGQELRLPDGVYVTDLAPLGEEVA